MHIFTNPITIIDWSVIEFVCIRVFQIIANEYSFKENISSGTRNVIALIFVHNKSHDLKNLFAMSQGNEPYIG